MSICDCLSAALFHGQTAALVCDRIAWINKRRWEPCVSIGAEFVDLRPVLRSCRAPLNSSGVHYTKEASERVARRIFEHCRYFLD